MRQLGVKKTRSGLGGLVSDYHTFPDWNSGTSTNYSTNSYTLTSANMLN